MKRWGIKKRSQSLVAHLWEQAEWTQNGQTSTRLTPECQFAPSAGKDEVVLDVMGKKCQKCLRRSG